MPGIKGKRFIVVLVGIFLAIPAMFASTVAVSYEDPISPEVEQPDEEWAPDLRFVTHPVSGQTVPLIKISETPTLALYEERIALPPPGNTTCISYPSLCKLSRQIHTGG